MSTTLTMIPPSGRDYGSVEVVIDALLGNRDFLVADVSSLWNAKPVNLRDLQAAGIQKARIRYAKLRKVVILDVPQPVKS